MDAERTMKQRMLAGELYRGDEEVAADARRARDLTHRINAAPADATQERADLFRELLGAIGEGTTIVPPFHCDFGHPTSFGARSFANFGLVCLDGGGITVGDDTQLGPYVQLLTATHPLEHGPRREKWESCRPITIGSNVWLGGGVVVCPGVTIGDDTVVGAGSVVVRDLPSGVLAVGNPARVVRALER